MEFYRKTRSHNMAVNPGNSVEAYSGSSGGTQGLATLITMIAVLVIILLFCFWSAPGIKDFCRRNICCYCPIDDPQPRELSTSLDTSGHHHYHPPSTRTQLNHGVPVHNETNSNAMPTIVLLPFGRMLVVDRSIFAQMEADDTGLDFLELSANVIRAHHNYLMQHDQDYRRQHQPTFSKSDLTLSQLSVEQHRPPAYDDIFGSDLSKTCESLPLPPSYSEANLLLRQLVRTGSLNVLHQQPFAAQQRSFSTRTVNDSIRIRYESERRVPVNRRFFARQQPSRSASLDEDVRSGQVNLSELSAGRLEDSSEQDHVVLVVGDDCAAAAATKKQTF